MSAATATPAVPAQWRADFEARARTVQVPPWAEALRRSGLERFEATGFPTTREEDWRFTSVAPIAEAAFRPAPAASTSMDGGQLDGAASWLVVNGRLASRPSPEPSGIRVMPLGEALAADLPELRVLGTLAGPDAGPFAALNAAFLGDGVVVIVAPGAVVDVPLHVCFLAEPDPAGRSVQHPRTLLLAGRGSQVTLVESYLGPDGDGYLTNAVTEVVLEDGAVVERYKRQREGDAAFHVATLGVRHGRDSRFTDVSLSLGARLSRNDIDDRLAAPGAECELLGVFVGDDRQHMDTHSRIDHDSPHCTSRQLYKGILDGDSRGVFHGRIRVQPDAQKTDALQTNKNLLLSPRALVHSTPALEIRADDVKCRHGSTTGQLDPTAMFYLRSRGLDEAAARALLTRAFAGDVLGRVRVPALRAEVEELLRSRWDGAGREEAR